MIDMTRTAPLGHSHKTPPRPSQAKQIKQLFGICFVLSSRLTEVEALNVKLCTALGLDSPLPAIGTGWITIKQAAFDSGFSQSHIRKLIAQGKIAAHPIGGRVAVRADTVPKRQ
ncbi:MAG: hypothetical protein P4M05_10100 [Bradyrhizobium sp.]|nr:hypothetical protein [Bradyrhizobium sp.]